MFFENGDTLKKITLKLRESYTSCINFKDKKSFNEDSLFKDKKKVFLFLKGEPPLRIKFEF